MLSLLASALTLSGCAGFSGADVPTQEAANSANSILSPEKLAALRIADDYLKAYAVFDLDKMESLYAEDAIFYDPTSEIWGDDGFHWRGRQEIMQGMRAVVAEYQPRIEYFIKEKYESAGHVVYSGKAKAFTKVDGVLMISCAPVTTIISVKEGKVVEHRDYADYETSENTSGTRDPVCMN